MKIFTKEHFWSVLLYCCSGIGLLLLVYMAVDTSIWVDEAYTMGIIQYSIPELIQVTAQDVHPPLYYILVKLVFLLTGMEDIYGGVILARVVSLVPYVIMWILSLTYIRKHFGELAGSLFSLCLVAAPQMIATGLEVRMYSWAILFLLIAFLMVCRLVLSQQRDTIIYTILGSAVLCAFYTHYFAAIAAAVILAVYFVLILVYDRKQFYPFSIMCAIDAVLYFPWILVAFGQIKDVSQDYWIAPIDRMALIRYFWYAFRSNEDLLGKATGFLLVVAALLCLIVTVYNRKQKEYLLAVGAMAVMPLTTLAGVAASFLLRPVFVERYMIPTFACFWLGFSYLISRCGKRKYLLVVVSVLFLGIGISEYRINIEDIQGNRLEMEETEMLFASMGNNDLIVHTNLNTEIPTAYYCGESTQFMMEESSTLGIDQIVFDNVENTMEPEELEKFVSKGKRVWCFVYPDSSGMSEEWHQLLDKGQYIGNYALDWCEFQVYMWN